MTKPAQSDPLVLLGSAAAGLKFENLPAEVVQRAKQRVLDTVGCLVAGYEAGIASEIRSFVLEQGGAAEATLLPGGQKTTVSLASLAHATYIHGLELSDAAPRGTVHPGNEIVPAALATAEKRKLGGAALIPAVVAGYEVEIRFGRAVFPSAFYRGWWTPGLFGGIGSAVATGHVLGLDGQGLDNTIGIVVNMLPTAMGRANEEGETIKWLLGGQSCAAGVLAAEMAARGVKGMRDVIKGWLPVVADEVHAGRLTEGILDNGSFSQWELLSGVLTKHYATVGPLTASLDATFDLVTKNNISAGDIKEIEVDCMRRTAIFNTRHPENDVAARASLPYCLAVAVCRKDPGLLLGPAFRDDVLKDRAVWAAADKVRITENEDYERQYPARSLARVTIRLHNGKSFTQEEDRSARGRYLTPTDEEIEHKFALIARPVLGAAKADKVVALVRKLEALPHVGELVAALKP
ncbi:MAG: MmgE/PrpD family protein [Betaproteobacteria bacterium]|nr:MmgE/PrpD family protein [Betaproteobacteria bacterium]